MNIVNICLCGPVTDNWSYQDNLLAKYQKKLGHNVTILTSQFVWDSNGNITICEKNDYINKDGVRMLRLKLKGSNNFNKKFKKYNGVFESIEKLKPDVIFIHGCQFIDIKQCVKYAKQYPGVKVYVDNHADFSNSATNWLSKNILHKIIWKKCAKMIEPFTTKFYGVLPARVDFLVDVYGIPSEKVELLVLGADDEKVTAAKTDNTKKELRNKYGVKPNEFLIITGGKIDNAKKQTLLLMQAVKEIGRKDIKLLVFGPVIEDLRGQVENLIDGNNIQYISWIDPEDTYKYFGAADLVIFPGRHSVFWEQVAGLGIPMIVKYWDGTTHIDVGGNCKFLYKDTVEEIKSTICEIVEDKEKYKMMSFQASSKGMKVFSYKRIAERSL
ncbi:glycosyltransferase family 4 protein [Priestia filamentosa]|uniref:glycosyltransferase family 4 protein n=1 Tax=Priestia filamentosa TaxID=1402861 RepID=UPI002E2328F6|nr:glycosyltransferase family 4 protein [Priestia filamentosa]